MAWLSGWAKRVEATSDHTKVDADLSDVPCRNKISISSGLTAADITAVFDELSSDANRKKIAVTTSDGTTQCYVEIDEWDHAGEIADLWVKFPALSSSADNIFYFYYDSTQSENTSYVGDTGDVPAQNVWDANFVMVQHMKDATTSTIVDSTSNANDGAKKAVNEPIEVVGKIGKGQDHDGSDDYIDINSSSPVHTGQYTISALAFPTVGITGGQDEMTVCIDVNNNTFYFELSNRNLFGQGTGWGIGWFSAGWKGTSTNDTPASQLDNWAHIIGTYDGSTFKIYKDGVLINSNNHTISGSAGLLSRIGYYKSQYPEQFNGKIDEKRFSNIARSAAWGKADYHSCWDTLLSYGAEETSGIVKILNETLQINEGIIKTSLRIKILNETLQINEGIIKELEGYIPVEISVSSLKETNLTLSQLKEAGITTQYIPEAGITIGIKEAI